MTQAYIGGVVATAVDGSDLAALLTAFDAAHKSNQAGTSRPAGIVAGGIWTDTASGYEVRVFNGTSDETLAKAANVLPLTGGTLTGGLTIDMASGDALFALDAASGSEAGITFAIGGTIGYSMRQTSAGLQAWTYAGGTPEQAAWTLTGGTWPQLMMEPRAGFAQQSGAISFDTSSGDIAHIYASTAGFVGLSVTIGELGGASIAYSFANTGTATAPTSWAVSSDERLKSDLADLRPGVVDGWRAVTYLHEPSGRREAGVIAQDVRAGLPEAVEEGPDGMLTVKVTALIAQLVAEVVDLRRRLAAVEAR